MPLTAMLTNSFIQRNVNELRHQISFRSVSFNGDLYNQSYSSTAVTNYLTAPLNWMTKTDTEVAKPPPTQTNIELQHNDIPK